MRARLFLPIALVACSTMTAGCVLPIPGLALRGVSPNRVLADQAPPPRIEPAPQATESCPLYTLPTLRPTLADLELGYIRRGYQVAHCDGMRDLALQALAEEHRLEDQQQALRAKRARPWFLRWLP